MELKYYKIKGTENIIRIEGLDKNKLKKAFAIKKLYVLSDEDGDDVFGLGLDTSNTLTKSVLTVDPSSIEDGCATVKTVGDPTDILIQTMELIDEIYKHVINFLESYDKAKERIKEV